MTARQHRIYFLLQVAAHRLRTDADNALIEAAGVTTAQAAVLSLVAGADNPTQRSIAAALGQNESAMTATVARLQKAGLLKRTRSTQDRRAWALALTAKGRRALDKATTPFERINARLDDAIAEIGAGKLADALQAIAGPHEKDASV